MISLPLRSAIGSIIIGASAAVWFLPSFGDEVKSTLATVLILLGSLAHPREANDERPIQPQPILWRERDIGQQFTLIMFHVVVLVSLAFVAYVTASQIDGFLGNALAAAFLCAGVWMTVRNWKNRNAG